MNEQLKILYHAKSILEDKNSYVLGLCGVMRSSINHITGNYIVNGEEVINYIPELIIYKPEKLPRLEIVNQLIKTYEEVHSTI